jgi:hypothetical protein
MAYGFIGFLGWGIFWVSFIIAIILFAKYKKMYSVFYLISIALYIFTAGFAIDVFEFGEFGILATLVISAVVFMLLGFYLSKVVHLSAKN